MGLTTCRRNHGYECNAVVQNYERQLEEMLTNVENTVPASIRFRLA
jgi:hypothetical protein